MQVERRTGKVCWPKTDVLPPCHATIIHLLCVLLYQWCHTWQLVGSHCNCTSQRSAGITILVKSIVNTNNYFGKKYCWYQYQYCFWKVMPIQIPILLWQHLLPFLHSATFIFSTDSSINKVNKMIVVEKMAKSLVYTSDMMLMSKHCSSIYFGCKTTVALSVTVSK